MYMNRYVIGATASVEQVGEFLASFAIGSPEPIELRLDSLKCNYRSGSPGSSSTQDFQGLEPVNNPDAVTLRFEPQKSSTLRFENDCGHERISRNLTVFGGKLILAGQLELPDTDEFAQKVAKGYSASLESGRFDLSQTANTRTRNQPRYTFLARVFEALSRQVA